MRRLLYHAPEPPIHSLKSFETYLLPCALFSPLPVAATKMDCPPVPPTNKSLNRIHNRLRVATSVCTKHAFTMSDMCWPLIFPIWSPCTACLASSSMPRSRNRQYSVQQGPRENKKLFGINRPFNRAPLLVNKEKCTLQQRFSPQHAFVQQLCVHTFQITFRAVPQLPQCSAGGPCAVLPRFKPKRVAEKRRKVTQRQ